MLSLIYSEEEDQIKESINKYISIFQSYKDNIPTLEDALFEMYYSSNCTKVQASDLVNDVLEKAKEKLKFNKKEINDKYPKIDDNDKWNKNRFEISFYFFEIFKKITEI